MKSKKEIREFNTGGMSSHWILIVCSLLYLVNFMDRQVLSAVLEPMRLDLGLNDFQAGVIQTVFLISIALFSFPVAYLADRWSRRKAVALMAIVWSGFTYITGLGKSFIGVLIPRTFVGAGEASFTAVGTAMVSAAYPKESRARFLGIFSLFSGLGAVFGVVLGGKISAYVAAKYGGTVLPWFLGGYISPEVGGWKSPFFVFAVPGILLAIAAFFLKDYKTVSDVDPSGRKMGFLSSSAALFKIPTLRWLYIGHVMHNVMAFSILTWLVAFFMRSREIGEDKAGMLMGIVSLMAVIGAPLGGILSDFWQKRNNRGRMYLPALADFLAAAAIIASLLLDVKGIGFAFALIWCALTMSALPSLGSVTQDVVSPGMKSMSWGMAVFVMYMLGGGWAPALVGFISDSLGGGTNGLKIALIIMSSCGFVGGVLFLFGSKKYPQDMEKVQDHILEEER